ncbi:MAG: M2 family metallopeptidase [Ignavibacteriales bacterium]|nr:M2 family metallopeptidase [Ignavibacteriales bacterium]
MMHRFPIFITILISAILFSSCKKEIKPRVTSKNELYLFLDTLEQKYESASSAVETARWNIATKNQPADIRVARGKLAEIFLDSSLRNIISEWKNQSGSLADKPLARRLELWSRAFTGGVVEFDNNVQKVRQNLAVKYFKAGSQVNGTEKKEYELIEDLRKEKNSKKRKIIWQNLSNTKSKHLEEYRKLVKLLNEKARAEGFPNFYSLSLYLDGVDEGRLLSAFDMLTDLTDSVYIKTMYSSKKKLKLKVVSPWNLELFTQENKKLPDKYFPSDSIMPVVYRYLDSIGFQKSKIKISVQENSNQNDFYKISVPGDVRVILKTENGNLNYQKSFETFAKGLRAALIKADYPILESYGVVPGTYSPSYEEGISKIFGELVIDSLWLRKFSKVKEKELKLFCQKRGYPGLADLRRNLKTFKAEYEFFKNPDINADSLEKMLLKKYLEAETDSQIVCPFILIDRFVTHPATFYRTIYAQMVSAQIQEVISDKFSARRHTDTLLAPWLIDHLFAGGEKLDWQERIRSATGKSVEPGPFLRKIGVEHSSLLTTGNQK